MNGSHVLNPALASLLQSSRPAGRVADLVVGRSCTTLHSHDDSQKQFGNTPLMKKLLTLALSLVALAFIAGGASPQKAPAGAKPPGIYDVKKYSERELLDAVNKESARQRAVQVFAQIVVLETLHSGSVSNAITLLEGNVIGEVNWLQGALKTDLQTNSLRGPVQAAVDKYEQFRVRHPR